MKEAAKRHAHMVLDARRTRPLLAALFKAIRKGYDVLDIGTGIGIIAIAAAKSGARHVWAIDCDAEALTEAAANAEKNGVADRISFVEGLSFDLRLPSRVDLITCETVGSFAFDENILNTILDAKRRLLKRGGRIVPVKLELWGALINQVPHLTRPAEIAQVRPSSLMTRPALISAVSFCNRIPAKIHARKIFTATRQGTAQALAVWPRISWWKNLQTDASPFSKSTHWKQGIMPLEPRQFKAGDHPKIELIIRPDPNNPYIMTERLWRWGN